MFRFLLPFQTALAFGGCKHLLKISGTTIGITMKLMPDVGIYQEVQKQNKLT